MRLNEIEARFNHKGSLVTFDAQQMRMDAALLIRAVRQLGATVQMYMEINNDTVTLPYQVDPDVLELLDETD